MVNTIIDFFEQCDSTSKIIIFKGYGKNFCAGGDIKHVLLELNKGNFEFAKNFFLKEFQMDHMIHTFTRPTIAILCGYTLGGGMGLAMGNKFRIGTEKLVMGMPETTIGFVPEVGSTLFLMTLPPHRSIGLYLGLTGNSMDINDALFCRFVTHYIPFNRIKFFESELLKSNFDTDLDIEKLITKYKSKVSPISKIEKYLPLIKRCFTESSIDEIFSNLLECSKILINKEEREWCKNTLNILYSKSPLSLKVTFRILLESKEYKTIGDAFKKEFFVSCNLIMSNDFKEGVRAMLVDKDKNPRWNPNNIKDVKKNLIQKYFEINEYKWTPKLY